MNGTSEKYTQLEKEIAEVLNRYSMENGSNTPDFVLALYLLNCLSAYTQAVRQRDEWHGKDDAHKESGRKAHYFNPPMSN